MGFFREILEHFNINHPDPSVEAKRDEVHTILNQTQGNISRARNVLEKEKFRHNKNVEEAINELDSVAERIARAINS